jgi:hypothetical protein
MRRRRDPVYIVLPLLLVLVALTAGARLVLNAIPDRRAAPIAEEPAPLRIREGAELIYHVRFTMCGHPELLDGGSEPVFMFNLSGISQPELQSLLPEGWTTVDFTPGRVVIEHTAAGLCSVCREKRYLGVRGDRIAIFRGLPPDGVLERVTEYEVKDDVRDQLEKGIPFTTMEELMQLLESYTS